MSRKKNQNQGNNNAEPDTEQEFEQFDGQESVVDTELDAQPEKTESEVIQHTVTEEDIEANPGANLVLGEVIDIPVNEIEEVKGENEIANAAFAALSHINEVWVTEDGHFHLDGTKGGEKFERTN